VGSRGPRDSIASTVSTQSAKSIGSAVDHLECIEEGTNENSQSAISSEGSVSDEQGGDGSPGLVGTAVRAPIVHKGTATGRMGEKVIP
jgi:hypothetical protein